MNRGRVFPVVAAGIAGAVVGLLLWLFGVSAAFAIATAAFALVLGIAWAGFAGAQAPEFPRTLREPRPGTRTDLVQVAWSLRGRRGHVGDVGVRHLRAFGRTRLAAVGLNPDAPADAPGIRALLGDRVAAILTGEDPTGLADVELCLTRLESVDTSPSARLAGFIPREDPPR